MGCVKCFWKFIIISVSKRKQALFIHCWLHHNRNVYICHFLKSNKEEVLLQTGREDFYTYVEVLMSCRHGLNCVPWNSDIDVLISNVMVFAASGLDEVMRVGSSWGLMSLWSETPDSSVSCSLRTEQRGSHLQGRETALSNTRIYGDVVIDFSAPRTIRKYISFV